MSNSLRTSSLALVALVLTGLAGSSQSTRAGKGTPDEPLRFSAAAKYVLVPVVITDRDGNHVTGLTKADFRILENGKEQKVASVEEIRATARPIVRAATAPNEFTNEIAGDPAPRRLVIILLDMMNTLSTPSYGFFANRHYAKKGLVTYMADHLESDSLYQVFVLEPSGLRMLHDFTGNTTELMESAKAVKQSADVRTTDSPAAIGASVGLSPLADFANSIASQTELAMSQTELAIGEAVRAELTLKSFRYIAEHVRTVPGRKELIWITTQTPIKVDPASPGLSPSARQEFVSYELYYNTMRLLDESHVSIYPVDPSGIEPGQIDASEYVSGVEMRGHPATKKLMSMTNEIRKNHDGLMAMAQLTGGRAYLNRNDTDNLIRDAVHDGSSYYMLSYPVDKSDTRPGWRRIVVRAGNYHVRARTGYFLDNATLDPTTTMSADLDLALTSPLDYTGLPLRLKIGEPVAADGKYKVGFTVLVVKGAIQTDSGDNNRLHVAYSYAVRTAAGEDAGHKGSVVDRHLTSAQLRQVENDGIGYADTLELAPGSYTLRVVARDNLTGRMGSVLGAIESK